MNTMKLSPQLAFLLKYGTHPITYIAKHTGQSYNLNSIKVFENYERIQKGLREAWNLLKQ